MTSSRCVLTIMVCLLASGSLRAQGSPGPSILANPHTAKFLSSPLVPECVTSTLLRAGSATQPAVVLAHFTKGCAIPWHWHTPSESLMMVQGTAELAMKGGGTKTHLQPGGFASMPPHHIHRVSCPNSCLMYVLYMDAAFDIHYVDKDGKEISLAEAVKQTPM